MSAPAVGGSPRAEWALVLAVLLAACASAATPVPASVVPATGPGEAIDGILQAARDHSVVAIGEIHGSVLEHEFLTALLTDPRFPASFDDIAVEFGASAHQSIIDRYVGGENVPQRELQRVWTETSQQSGVWDAPIYAEFFDTVRNVNMGLPRDQSLRVLLGDPDSAAQLECEPPACEGETVDRDAHFARIVEEESLNRGRRALVVAGLFHVLRGTSAHHQSLTDQLDSLTRGATFVVIPGLGAVSTIPGLAAHVESWPSPSLAALPGSWIGSQPSSLLQRGTVLCDRPPCGTPESIGRLEDVADAFLFLRDDER